jgi:hypothetical protein
MPRHRSETRKATRGLVLAALIVTSLATSLSAQQNPCLDRTVAVNVLTEKGASVTDLTEKSFRAEYQREAVQVVSAKRNLHSPRILILLDASGSMTDFAHWYAATTVAKGLFLAAPESTSFALLTFATRVEDNVDFSKGRVAVAKELSALGNKDWNHYKGSPRKTAFLDALGEGLDSFEAPEVGDTVFAITDEGDNASRMKVPEVRRKFLSTGVRFFCFLVTTSVSSRARTTEEATGPDVLASLAHATGGDVASVELSPLTGFNKKRDDGIVQSGTSAMLQEITEFYRVELRLPQSADKESDLKLKLNNDAGKKNSRLRLISPGRIPPCR